MVKENQECLRKIKRLYPHFSVTEKKIADYVIKQPNRIIHASINQVAEDLGVADSTVFRFCKRLGYKGYQAMKIALASEVVSPIQDIHEKIAAGDSADTVAAKVFKANMKTLEETLAILDHDSLNQAVSALLNADAVKFFGSGGSSVVAMDGYHKFLRTGLKVNAVMDNHFQLVEASQMSKTDCAVFISHTGSSRDILDILEVVKAAGAKTIAITHNAKSPLSEGVDIPLYTVSEETEYRAEALSSRIAQLALMDVLYVNVMMERGEKAQEAVERMRAAISNKRI